MFTTEQLSSCLTSAWYQEGYQHLERNILRARLGLAVELNKSMSVTALSRFTQSVLSSVDTWTNPHEGLARTLCVAAADIEAAWTIIASIEKKNDDAHLHKLRSSILYDIAGMPGVSATLAATNGFSLGLKSYLGRSQESAWGKLVKSVTEGTQGTAVGAKEIKALMNSYTIERLIEEAIAEALTESGSKMQNTEATAAGAEKAIASILNIVTGFQVNLKGAEVTALRKSVALRQKHSTLAILSHHSNLLGETLHTLQAPAELWPVQKKSIEAGLLDDSIKSFGLAAPTGTGKTALARILLADFLNKYPGKKALYISPSRALVNQIARDLISSLGNIGISVAALGAHLTVHEQLSADPYSSNVLVFTPEKADLLMRIEPDFLDSVGLVIIDEAHHIEQGLRGILLEFYLWRLRSLIPQNSRIVQLSAVSPNIDELVSWLGTSENTRAIKVEWRTNRLRLGTFQRKHDGSAIVKFEGLAPYTLFGQGECSANEMESLAELANRLASNGIVLVLTTSPNRAEQLAELIASKRVDVQEPTDATSDRFDARVERELYPEAPLRNLYKKRVAYHHAQLPPRVRIALEDVISKKQIDIVCATTTLAEGVNFPFSTVVVESLIAKDYEISPRALWNIAGRAGRFGVDSEGHCILFRPELWANKLRNYNLEQYLQTKLDAIPPVRSALGLALQELKETIESGEVDIHKLENINLSDILTTEGKASKKVARLRGLINLMRVGYVHANSSKLISLSQTATPEFENELLASRQMPEETKKFASTIGLQQRNVIKRALENNNELLSIAARIGWALETQESLYEWILTLESWKLEQFGRLVIAGRIVSIDKLGYLLGPVSNLMAEFEGDKLGGFTAYVAVRWLEGLPLTAIRDAQTKKPDFSRLVKIIYARVQYLLPWALLGVDELMQYSAKQRGIKIESGIRDLSVLAAEGVPNFDALQLVINLSIERVDAVRLSQEYSKTRRDTDIIGWLKSLEWNRVVAIVRSHDKRRLDPDLRVVWEKIQ